MRKIAFLLIVVLAVSCGGSKVSNDTDTKVDTTKVDTTAVDTCCKK